MSTAAHADDAHAAHDGEHPPEPHYSSKVEHPILGIYLFLGSEAMLFGSFFAAYFFARVAVPHEVWPPYRPELLAEGIQVQYHLPVFLALINTIILVTSSFTAHWAVQALKANNRSGLIAGLSLTSLLGLTFLLIQIREYMRIGFSPRDEAFGSTFYALTGLHGIHVFVGLSLLTFALIRSIRGHYRPAHHHGLEVPIIYWHFVDVMWIVVYVTVYVL
ncbi:MAG: cytochrome c oxidase subunit 3 [Actinomycetia bacterium]|nr:cytochrome c oxidase subunit 3 [Actinomycetes bacterium]